MEDSLTYNVVSSGNLVTEFDLSDVQGAVADLFKITPEKAGSIVGKRAVLKKGLDHKQANAYKQKLESIGLEIVLKPNEKKVIAPLSLSLEPIEDKSLVIAVPEAPVANTNRVTCEKCQLEQPKSTQCTGCGVYFHKISPVVENVSVNSVRNKVDANNDDTVVMAGDALKSNGIIAGIVAAVLGALLWKGIVVAFEYELGLIAWAIGGAIGFAVAFTGSKGQASGVMCGVLALVAILGGKYMVIESFRAELTDIVSSASVELTAVYDAQVEEAKAFSKDVTDEQSLRQFIVDYEYSDSYEVKGVTVDEIAYFKESMEPSFDALNNGVEYEEWYNNSFQGQIANYSTLEVMQDDFGFMDVLFLFLGVGTAFRLGRGEERMV